MGVKTLHLTNSWHAASGGVATFYRALMAAANRRGQQIRLVVPGESDRLEEPGQFCKIYYVKAPRAPFNSDYRVIYPAQYLPAGSPIQEILAAERPDVVEICDKYTLNYLGALLRGRLLKALDFRPVVVGLSCERMDDNFRVYVGRVPLSGVFSAAYMKWVYFPFFDHHIAVSEYTAVELRTASRGHIVPRKIWIRSMGVDLHHFSPARQSAPEGLRLRQSLAASSDSVLLLYAGRLAPEKNLALLFEVFARLVKENKREYHLLVAGEGIERSRWEKFCSSRMPGRAWFLGHIKDPDDLARLLANADAFVHPNHREPFGIAPLEAMASGLPVVLPNCGGVASYANSENAWLASPDPASFAEAIKALLSHKAEAARRAQNALRTASEFSWRKAAESFLNLYAELHRAAVTCVDTLPLPAFSSTPPSGVRLAFSRGVSQSAERIFRLASSLFWRPGS